MTFPKFQCRLLSIETRWELTRYDISTQLWHKKGVQINHFFLSNLGSKHYNYLMKMKVDRGRKFSPVHEMCQLCITEAYYNNFHPEMAALNSKSEIFSSCRHKKPALLIKPKRGRKRKPPGTWKLLILSCDFYIHFSYCCMPEKSRWFICLKLRVAVQWSTEIKNS